MAPVVGARVVANPPNTERSPALVVQNGGGICAAVGAAAESRHSPTAALSEWPLMHPTQEWPPLRCTPSLQAPQGPLVDFLTSGYGYDDQSVATAVRLGNEHFGKRELGRAIDFYGAAYEIGRLHFDYKPLMHDLIMRRVICYSMLGDLKQALHEADLALRVVPHSATALLYQGLLHSKQGGADEANQAFQLAVAQCRELRSLVDCLVALFMLAQGHCDRAIQVCSQVLTRQPRYPFALLVRGDAYKFHPSGYFSRQAADDYTMLLEIDIGLQPLIGDMMTPHQHARFDEMVLQFHPRLDGEGPRAYDQYPMCAVYRLRRPFLVASFVLFATAKLKTCVRSTQLVQNVERRNEELLQARAAAERKVRQLVETQQKLAALESSSFCEVWGPADPEHVNVRKYRRYWMERPLGFPRRAAGGGEQGGEGPPWSARSPSPPGYRDYPDELPAAPRYLQQSPSGSAHRTLLPHERFLDDDFAGAMASSPAPPRPPSQSRARLPPEEAPVLLYAQHPQRDVSSHRSAAPEGSHVGGGDVSLHDLTAAMRLEPVRPPAQEEPPVADAADLLLEAAEPHTPPHPAAAKRSKEDVYVERPPPQKLGHDWNESQWLAKALELADTFGSSLAPPATSPRSPPRSPRVAPPTPPCAAMIRLPHGEEMDLASAIERYGFEILPDWFTPLDRIYEVTDMGPFHTGPDPLVAASGLAGAPGYSYVVPPKPAGRRPVAGRFVGSGGGGGAPVRGATGEAVMFNSEALLRRYQHRLLQTSLPGSR